MIAKSRVWFIRVVIFATCFCGKANVNAAELETVAERSQFQATAHYEDVMAFCKSLASDSQHVELSSLGRTHEKRDLPLLILADPPVKNASAARQDSRPVIFAMGNIHAGEVCGKEALLMLARDLVGRNGPDRQILRDVIVVFAPIYNADGNERFAKDNRPGQIGPAQGMGQRTNALGLDLNRDHMKLESPEARSLARFLTDWQPLVAIDCHTTDGSRHRHHVTFDTPRHPATDARLLEFSRDKFLTGISKTLQTEDGYRSFFYGNFNRDHSRWDSYPALPRYSTHYFGLRNCVGVLSEAYAFIPFKDRVLVTYAFVERILRAAHRQRDRLVKIVTAAKTRSRSVERLALQFEPVELGGTWTIPGWKEDVAQRGRPLSADDVEVDYEVQYFGKSQPTHSVAVPAGYLIPAAKTDVLQNLRHHGILLQPLQTATKFSVSHYTVTSYNRAARAFQGHRLVRDVKVTRSEVAESEFPRGTVFVSTDQPLARLVVNLLEPESADGLGTWNFFDDELANNTWPVVRVEQQP